MTKQKLQVNYDIIPEMVGEEEEKVQNIDSQRQLFNENSALPSSQIIVADD